LVFGVDWVVLLAALEGIFIDHNLGGKLLARRVRGKDEPTRVGTPFRAPSRDVPNGSASRHVGWKPSCPLWQLLK
jgi:hypothetical protein